MHKMTVAGTAAAAVVASLLVSCVQGPYVPSEIRTSDEAPTACPTEDPLGIEGCLRGLVTKATDELRTAYGGDLKSLTDIDPSYEAYSIAITHRSPDTAGVYWLWGTVEFLVSEDTRDTTWIVPRVTATIRFKKKGEPFYRITTSGLDDLTDFVRTMQQAVQPTTDRRTP